LSRDDGKGRLTAPGRILFNIDTALAQA